jgi:hypothetical protein
MADTSRDQYTSHKLYLEKRAGNRYYNLGYMMYKEIIEGTASASTDNLKNAIINFNIALLFNKNDVDSVTRKKYLCDTYGPNGDANITNIQFGDWETEAKKQYKECKC